MLRKLMKTGRPYQTKFSFGATSAIITILGLITGLDTLPRPKLSIIIGILIIALADNISDSFGIHIYQESECIGSNEIWLSTLTNFLTRLFVSLSFVILVAMLPIKLAVVCSVTWGLTLLSVMSYVIAKERKVSPYPVIFEHLSIATVVILASNFFGKFVIGRFQ